MTVVPYEELAPETLHNLIMAFVGREGTDYGIEEVPLDQKIAQVKSQLQSGKVVITYCSETESANIVLVEDIKPGE